MECQGGRLARQLVIVHRSGGGRAAWFRAAVLVGADHVARARPRAVRDGRRQTRPFAGGQGRASLVMFLWLQHQPSYEAGGDRRVEMRDLSE